MNIDDVQEWCRDNRIDARMIIRGGDFSIRHDAQGSQPSGPSINELLHWELTVEGKRCPTSPSDMERLVTGKMTLDDFLRRLRTYYSPENA